MAIVGVSVGFFVGFGVGVFVGFLVGSGVGVFVGSLVGAGVGIYVGFLVGIFVTEKTKNVTWHENFFMVLLQRLKKWGKTMKKLTN